MWLGLGYFGGRAEDFAGGVNDEGVDVERGGHRVQGAISEETRPQRMIRSPSDERVDGSTVGAVDGQYALRSVAISHGKNPQEESGVPGKAVTMFLRSLLSSTMSAVAG